MAQSSREIYWSAILADFRRSGLTHVEFRKLRRGSLRLLELRLLGLLEPCTFISVSWRFWDIRSGLQVRIPTRVTTWPGGLKPRILPSRKCMDLATHGYSNRLQQPWR
jgi:hypothetical protein